jgi:hypothetical protein
MESQIKYNFRNDSSDAIIVIIEPWAEEFSVDPGSILSMNILFAKIGLLETAVSPKYFTLWLWAGCRVEVCLDGKDQTPPSLSIPAFG